MNYTQNLLNLLKIENEEIDEFVINYIDGLFNEKVDNNDLIDALCSYIPELEDYDKDKLNSFV